MKFQVWFGHSLRKYPVHDWSIEQKWISVLLPLLILYNSEHRISTFYCIYGRVNDDSFLFSDPLFPTIFLVNSWVPGMLDAILQTTFLCAILMFWLCVYHGLRQVMTHSTPYRYLFITNKN